jgi:hypothetical protein
LEFVLKAIANHYDGPKPSAKRRAPESVNLDYVASNNAAELDAGIRECIKGVQMSILAMGIALAKIKARGLYADLRYHSMNDYLENLCDEMRIERSTAHNWLYIGEAFTKYRHELERVDFSDEDGVTKLMYVDRALELYEKREVFRNVKEMSFRAFKEYIKGEEGAQRQPAKIRVVGNQIFVGKKLAVTFSDELDSQTKTYLAKINVEAGEALEAGEVLYTTRLYDMNELRRFERRAETVKKELRVR